MQPEPLSLQVDIIITCQYNASSKIFQKVHSTKINWLKIDMQTVLPD